MIRFCPSTLDKNQLKTFSIYSVALSSHPKRSISTTFLNGDKHMKPRYLKDGIILSKLIPPQNHHLKVFCQRWVAESELNYVTWARQGKEKIMCGRFDVISKAFSSQTTVGLSVFQTSVRGGLFEREKKLIHICRIQNTLKSFKIF